MNRQPLDNYPIRHVVGDDYDAPRIYCWVNGGDPGWLNVQALSEDGKFLAGHICSHPSFGPGDMGCLPDSNIKHEHYAKAYPNGYVVVWCDSPNDPGILDAYERHLRGALDDPEADQDKVAAWLRALDKLRAETAEGGR